MAPPVRLCTDNAVMVAWAGIERLRLGLVDALDFAPRPRWPLEAPDMRRMNYRHAFHAGNFADCMKHALLVWLLRALQRKPAPLFVLDTHAGVGRYDLDAGPAARTGEWRQRHCAGCSTIRRRALADYVGAGASARPVSRLAGAHRAPCCGRTTGWPAANCIPRTLPRCAAASRGDRQVAVHHRDAWEALGALLPPKERRGLVLIDPPFEDPHEFAQLAAGLARRPCALPHRRVRRLVSDQASRAGARSSWPTSARAACATSSPPNCCLREPLDPARLNGCGMLVVNPPYRFEQEVPPILAALLDRLGEREAGRGALRSGGSPMSSVAVIGAGAWGTALAIQAARAGNDVTLWARDPARARAIAASRENPRLPGVRAARTDHGRRGDCPTAADLVLLAVPMQHLRGVLARLPPGVAPLVVVRQGGRGRHAAPAAGDRGGGAARRRRPRC